MLNKQFFLIASKKKEPLTLTIPSTGWTLYFLDGSFTFGPEITYEDMMKKGWNGLSSSKCGSINGDVVSARVSNCRLNQTSYRSADLFIVDTTKPASIS